MCVFASLGAASLVALNATAQTQAPSATTSSTPAPAASAPVKLPYGVDDVLKLSRAHVSEEVTVNYIRNTGTIYNLAPNDIVYLRNEGVSDRVINTMLDQRKTVPAETATQSTPVSSGASAAVPQYAPAYVQPAPVYAQPEPTYTAASTLYVIPYPYAGYRYPGYSPYYYGGYYGYGGPSVAFGFGYSSGGRCGPYYGGYHGNYYGGGHYGYWGHR